MNKVTHRLSHWMRTDVAYLTKNGSWLWFGRSITILVLFGASVIYANVLDPNDLGMYQFIITMGGFFGIFALVGMNTSMVRTVARGAPNVLDAGVRSYLCWSFGTLGLGLIAALYYYWQENSAMAVAMIIGATMIPLQRASGLYVAFIEGQKKFKVDVLFAVISTIVPTLAVVGTIVFTHNPIYLATVSFVTGAVVNGGLYWYCRAHYKTNGADGPILEEMISYSKHLSLMQFLGRSVPYVEKIVLVAFTTPATLAAYHFASLAPKYCNEIDRVLKKLLQPKLSAQDYSTLKRTLPRKVFFYFVLMLLVTVTYILLAPVLFAFVFPQYTDYVLHSQIFALSLLFQPITVFGRALTAHMKKRVLYIQSIIIPCCTLAILVTLVPLYGLWGVIFTKLAQGAIHNVIVSYFFIRTN